MKKFLSIFFVVVVVCIAAVMWYQGALKPIDSLDDSRVPFKIAPGTPVVTIAQDLEEKGLIQSQMAFVLYTRLNELQSSLQAGSFVLKKSYSVQELVEILQSGKGEEIVITIPEGFTVTEIDALLAEKDMIQPGQFLQCAQQCDLSTFTFLPTAEGLLPRGGKVEGYLYPDTYFVLTENFTVESFMNRLLSTFERKIINGFQQQISSTDRSLEQIVIMASLIEKEAITNEERPMISDILWKRFDNNLGLGVDATVRYMLGKQTDPITIADLNDNSPYNTRKFRGLPPGAIASPGAESILAAIGPKANKYWYYLHGNDGQIHYAVSNEEHNVNRYKYIKGGG